MLLRSTGRGAAGNAHITGWWKRIGTDRIDELRNPVRFHTGGQEREGIVLGSPKGSALEDYALVIDLEFTKMSVSNEVNLLLTGGFGDGLGEPETESSFLAMQYPVDDPQNLPSVDLPGVPVKSTSGRTREQRSHTEPVPARLVAEVRRLLGEQDSAEQGTGPAD